MKPCTECSKYENCCENAGWCDAQWDRAYNIREGKEDCWTPKEGGEE